MILLLKILLHALIYLGQIGKIDKVSNFLHGAFGIFKNWFSGFLLIINQMGCFYIENKMLNIKFDPIMQNSEKLTGLRSEQSSLLTS